MFHRFQKQRVVKRKVSTDTLGTSAALVSPMAPLEVDAGVLEWVTNPGKHVGFVDVVMSAANIVLNTWLCSSSTCGICLSMQTLMGYEWVLLGCSAVGLRHHRCWSRTQADGSSLVLHKCKSLYTANSRKCSPGIVTHNVTRFIFRG